MSRTLSQSIDDVRYGSALARTRAAARLMTYMIEHPERIGDLGSTTGFDTLRPRQVIGITGPPGAGKSTLTATLVGRLLELRPTLRIAVAAVDPSSPLTGGAVLGDRIRMMRHALDERVFIRSLATRGELGGICRGVEGVLAVAALWGADVAIVETVGVGQNEVEVARLADVTCLVLAPGQGDGVQWLKAGLMEVGDLFVVNKADRPDAQTLATQLTAAVDRMQAVGARHRRSLRNVHSQAPRPEAPPPVVAVSAESGGNIDELLRALRLMPEASLHV